MTNGIQRKYVQELADSLAYVRSVDGYLVKLGSIAAAIEDDCKKGEICDPRQVLEEVLNDPLLEKYIEQLSCYMGEVLESVNTDPRHKILRKYIDILKTTLEGRRCSGKKLETLTPPALWSKEETEIRVIYKKERIKPRWFAKSIIPDEPEKLLNTLLTASIIIFLLSLIIHVFIS